MCTICLSSKEAYPSKFYFKSVMLKEMNTLMELDMLELDMLELDMLELQMFIHVTARYIQFQS